MDFDEQGPFAKLSFVLGILGFAGQLLCCIPCLGNLFMLLVLAAQAGAVLSGIIGIVQARSAEQPLTMSLVGLGLGLLGGMITGGTMVLGIGLNILAVLADL